MPTHPTVEPDPPPEDRAALAGERAWTRRNVPPCGCTGSPDEAALVRAAIARDESYWTSWPDLTCTGYGPPPEVDQ